MKRKFDWGVAALVVAIFSGSTGYGHEQLGNKLGTVQFEVRGKREAQEHVVRGVKLVHHMMYLEADREFAAATEADPECAMAWWGRAMTLIHPMWPDMPSANDRKVGAEQVRRGLAAKGLTPRERDYLETLDIYFGAAEVKDYPAKLSELDVAWAKLAEKYPGDLDASAFSALYHLAPARFVAKDKSHRLQLEAVQQLQGILARVPDHPGAQHYKIHALDFPLLADRALEVCDTYSGIAPDVPHALHMPTHIFTRRGLWDKSIDFNLRSAAAARKLGENDGALNGHYAHALDYLVYAYLQSGQYAKANEIRERVLALKGPYAVMQPTTMAFAFAAIPSRCVLERQAWGEAAKLPLHEPATFAWTKDYLNCDSIVRFARAIGAARTGQLEAARAEIAELDAIHRDLVTGKRPAYWAAQAETQKLAATAWVKLAEKDADGAVALMRRAVELEAKTDKEAVTPGEVLPAGDLLGDMLLEIGKPQEALAAYEAQLVLSPNRLNTLYGAAIAAERGGDKVKARDYFRQLAATTNAADAGIPRVELARKYLAAVAQR